MVEAIVITVLFASTLLVVAKFDSSKKHTSKH